MTFAADERARVPFALVGVLLLVGASAYATGLATQAPTTVERPAGEAMDAATRDARPTLRAAVRQAARGAARDPVTTPADTPAGRVLNDSQPFVDALRVRIAVAAREELGTVERTRSGRTATATLPEIDGMADLRQAKRDVEVSPADDGTAMHVTVRNLTIRATRAGRTVATRRVNVSLTVATPVLALHDRTERYENRLNRDALAGPGLERSLTGELYPVAWARGYARYGGVPIQNVLGNRHVELSTNNALLAQQRAAFGRPDEDGLRALRVATARVAVKDVLEGRAPPEANRATTLLRPNAVDDEQQTFDPEMPESTPVRASPNASADQAYLSVAGENLSGTLRESYCVEAHLRTSTEQTHDGQRPAASPPGENWTLVESLTRTSTAVREGDEAASSADTGAIDTTRQVVVRHTVTRLWHSGAETETTTATWTDRYRVRVRVDAAYAPQDAAPERPTEPLFRRGGALDGTNLAGVREAAARDLLAANGGADTVAKAAAHGQSLDRRRSAVGERPAALRSWVAQDLQSLRQRVANLSTTVPRRRVASGNANPARRLAQELRARRGDLVAAPSTYDGVADRARVAVRAAYVDAVIRALETRANRAEDRNADFVEKIGDRSARELSQLVAVGTRGGAARLDPGERPPDAFAPVPDGSPAYLTLTAVDDSHVPTVAAGESVHPLTAKTTNWFALPYGDAADTIVGALFPGKQVSMGTAAGALVAANETAAGASNATLDGKRATLTEKVASAVAAVERESCRAELRGTVSEADCTAAVDAAAARWPGVGHRALAIENGSFAAAVGQELRAQGVAARPASLVAVRMRVDHRKVATEDETSVPAETTNETVTATRQVGKQAATEVAKSGLENVTNKVAKRATGSSRLPAGLPVAPTPGSWYATVNAWSVTVRGEYQRFAVRATSGAPDGGGAMVRYVRDGDAVRLDVDGDGASERLGTSERVSFEASTTVVVAVPPGMPGVGDVDGNPDERSEGWPCPGAEDTDDCVTAESTGGRE